MSASSDKGSSCTDRSSIDALAKRLVNRVTPVLRAYRGSWFCDQSARLTRTLFRQALEGITSLGLYAVSAQGTSKWACIDVDYGEAIGPLWRIIRAQESTDHLALELSRRGYHLWAFFATPVPWHHARAYGLSLLAGHKLTAEVFPKGPGLNGVKCPLSRHPKTGLTYPFLNLTSAAPEDDGLGVLRRIQPTLLDVPDDPPVRLRQVAPPGNYGTVPTGSHLDLLSEVAKYTDLRHIKGQRYHGLCPFHLDHHLSLGVSGILWQCWACGIGGFLEDFQRLVKERGL